jgi:AGCS family alanine or glycine:cation symporter
VVGAVGELGLIWTVADIMNALMAIPNLIALIALSGTVFAVSRAYFRQSDRAPDA